MIPNTFEKIFCGFMTRKTFLESVFLASGIKLTTIYKTNTRPSVKHGGVSVMICDFFASLAL